VKSVLPMVIDLKKKAKKIKKVLSACEQAVTKSDFDTLLL